MLNGNVFSFFRRDIYASFLTETTQLDVKLLLKFKITKTGILKRRKPYNNRHKATLIQ